MSRGLKVLGEHQPRIEAEGGDPLSLRFPTRFLEMVDLYSKLTVGAEAMF